ncbi:hypothetical protein LJR030_004435 [Rhizobium sp. LjRoot30]|uniref:hypothetical protein n=1 Tax=Rhizobium sp. LjRoot30 TaxID=3342320 RepID=UPI003ECE96D4
MKSFSVPAIILLASLPLAGCVDGERGYSYSSYDGYSGYNVDRSFERDDRYYERRRERAERRNFEERRRERARLDRQEDIIYGEEPVQGPNVIRVPDNDGGY